MNGVLRKKSTTLAAVLAVAGALTGCGSGTPTPAGSDDQVTLRVGTATSSFGFAPFYVAEDMGYFADEKITIEGKVIQASTNATAALVSGSIDVGLLAPLTAIQAKVSGQPVMTVATMTKGTQNILVLAKDYAQSKGVTTTSSHDEKVAALKGARIATNGATAGATVVVKAFLKENNINADKDVKFVFITDQAALVNSLKAGVADAFMFVPPQATAAVTDGSGMLAFTLGDDPVTKDIANTGIVVNADWLSDMDKRNVLVRFMKAIWRADQYIQENGDEAGKLIQPRFKGIDGATYDLAWKNAYSTFPPTPEITETNVKAVLDTLINPVRESPIHPSFAEVADNSVVEAAKP